MNHNRRFNIWCISLLMAILSGCATIPEDALKMTPDTLERRTLQTRRFEGTNEKKILGASAGVLQDLGFNIDESETQLGVIVASKERSAVSGSQVAAAIAVALLGGGAMATDKSQKFRVSLVVRPTDLNVPAAQSSNFNVRVTLQRIIWNTQGQITKIEAIDDPEIYRNFFEKLSKSLFLEANSI